MSTKRTLTILVVSSVLALPAQAQTTPQESSAMKRLTPVVFVEEIEPCLPFWTETLGFEKTMEVPADEEGRLGFAAFRRGQAEVMYQTMASLAEDVPALVDEVGGATFLYVEVEDAAALDALEKALAGADHVIPRRKTFYGADEIVVRDPCGTVVTLAAFEGQEGGPQS